MNGCIFLTIQLFELTLASRDLVQGAIFATKPDIQTPPDVYCKLTL